MTKDMVSIEQLGKFVEENKGNGKLLFKTEEQEQKTKLEDNLTKLQEQLNKIKESVEVISELPPNVLGEVYLENTNENHYKFYRIKLLLENTKYILETSWGRIGNNPQFQYREFGKVNKARDEMDSIVLRKINSRGYHIVK